MSASSRVNDSYLSPFEHDPDYHRERGWVDVGADPRQGHAKDSGERAYYYPNPDPDPGYSSSYSMSKGGQREDDDEAVGLTIGKSIDPTLTRSTSLSRSRSDSSNYNSGSDSKRSCFSRGKRNRTKLKNEEEDDELDDEERELLRKGMIDWKSMSSWKFWFRVEWIGWYIALIVIAALVILMTLYHKQIIAWLKPVATYIKGIPAGWLIPVGVLFVISFPPLFGHEIVAILCGVVWGLWIGFGIVAFGTFLGEMGNFYAFRYCCRSRAEKIERNNIHYALLAHVVRQGGFKIALLARLSAIPGHFTTAVFSTCGMGVWVFTLACILSMPKQLIVVYLGVALENTNASTNTKIAQDVMLVVSFLITIAAAWFIYYRMNKARLAVFRQHKKDMLRAEIEGGDVEGANYVAKGQYDRGPEFSEDASSTPILLQPGQSSRNQFDQSYETPFQHQYRQQDGTSVYNVDHETAPRDNPSYAHQQTGNGDLGQHQIDRRDTPGLGFANPQSAQATGQGYMKTDAPTMHPWTADIGPMEPLTFPAPHSSNSNAWQRGEADASNVSDLNAGRPPVSGNPEFTAGFRG